jgi:hypothetical protein
MGLVISKGLTLRKGWQPMDPDAAAYITAVETADDQALEEKTKIAIDNFVLGCKADGIWSAIKASCILAGARTLAGALVPLVGAAPTNVDGLFVSGDYNRKTGLVGNGSTKYLDSNRNNNADPQDSRSLSIWLSSHASLSGRGYLGTSFSSGAAFIINSGFAGQIGFRLNSSSGINNAAVYNTGFIGIARSASTDVMLRGNSRSVSVSNTSTTPLNATNTLFLASGGYSDARLAFYSIGESLDLALLDARVTDLINAFAAAIP